MSAQQTGASASGPWPRGGTPWKRRSFVFVFSAITIHLLSVGRRQRCGANNCSKPHHKLLLATSEVPRGMPAASYSGRRDHAESRSYSHRKVMSMNHLVDTSLEEQKSCRQFYSGFCLFEWVDLLDTWTISLCRTKVQSQPISTHHFLTKLEPAGKPALWQWGGTTALNGVIRFRGSPLGWVKEVRTILKWKPKLWTSWTSPSTKRFSRRILFCTLMTDKVWISDRQLCLRSQLEDCIDTNQQVLYYQDVSNVHCTFETSG